MMDDIEEVAESVLYDEVEGETALAYRVRFDDQVVWLPKSKCRVEDDRLIRVPMWLIKKNGLEGFIDD